MPLSPTPKPQTAASTQPNLPNNGISSPSLTTDARLECTLPHVAAHETDEQRGRA